MNNPVGKVMRAMFSATSLRHVFVLKPCDPSQHNTLRYDQVERRRKTTRRANRLKFKRYRRAIHE